MTLNLAETSVLKSRSSVPYGANFCKLYLTKLTDPGFFIILLLLLPHDAMLARYMLSSCVCPSVRLSHAGNPVLYQNG